MDRHCAEKMMLEMTQLGEAVGLADAVVSELGPGAEKQRLIDALGTILKTSWEDVMAPIRREYPDVMPSEAGWRSPRG